MDLIDASTGLPLRRLPLAGPVNFRDLGGYAALGGRSLRWRQLYRSDGLATLTETDHRVLVDELGLRTILDLRAAEEVAASVPQGLLDAGLRHVNVPIFDETRQLWREDDGPGFTIAQFYYRMLDLSSDRFVEALRLIAEAPGPIVFHCAAGKDRTGILAAVVLSLLGVSTEDIVADLHPHRGDLADGHRIAGEHRLDCCAERNNRPDPGEQFCNRYQHVGPDR